MYLIIEMICNNKTYINKYIFIMKHWAILWGHKSCTYTPSNTHSSAPPGLLFLLSSSNNVLRGALKAAERSRWLISFLLFFCCLCFFSFLVFWCCVCFPPKIKMQSPRCFKYIFISAPNFRNLRRMLPQTANNLWFSTLVAAI